MTYAFTGRSGSLANAYSRLVPLEGYHRPVRPALGAYWAPLPTRRYRGCKVRVQFPSTGRPHCSEAFQEITCYRGHRQENRTPIHELFTYHIQVCLVGGTMRG